MKKRKAAWSEFPGRLWIVWWEGGGGWWAELGEELAEAGAFFGVGLSCVLHDGGEDFDGGVEVHHPVACVGDSDFEGEDLDDAGENMARFGWVAPDAADDDFLHFQLEFLEGEILLLLRRCPAVFLV